MKRLLSFVLICVALLSLFTLPCMAAQVVTSTDITATVPEGFNLYTKNSLPTSPSKLEELGCTYDELKASFSNNNYLFLAHSNALKCSITLSEKKTKVSETVGNLYLIKEPASIDNVGKLLLGEVWESALRIKQVEKDYALFFRVEMYDSDLSNIMYVSVINSVTYTLCLTTKDGMPSENVLSAFEGIFQELSYEVEGMTVKEDSTATKGKKILNVFIIVAGVFVLIILVMSILKDFDKMKTNNQRQDNVKKYKKPLR